MNQQIFEGNWNEIKGKLREKWGQLTDDDLPQVRGDAEQIIGTIQRKTGEARERLNSIYRKYPSSALPRRSVRHAIMLSTLPTKCAPATPRRNRFVRDRAGTSRCLLCFGCGCDHRGRGLRCRCVFR